MAEKIILNNGQEIEGATIVEVVWSADQINIHVPNSDLVQTAILFGNSDNTQKIEYYHSIVKDTYTGYTIVSNIGLDLTGTGVDVLLKGNEISKEEHEYTIPYNFIPEVIANSINEKELNQNGTESNDSAGED